MCSTALWTVQLLWQWILMMCYCFYCDSLHMLGKTMVCLLLLAKASYFQRMAVVNHRVRFLNIFFLFCSGTWQMLWNEGSVDIPSVQKNDLLKTQCGRGHWRGHHLTPDHWRSCLPAEPLADEALPSSQSVSTSHLQLGKGVQWREPLDSWRHGSRFYHKDWTTVISRFYN